MGAGNSRNFSGEVIYCGTYVGHSDVSNFIRTHNIQGEDRTILQGCYDLFESKPDFVWQNCAIEVMCSSFDVKFVSGDQSNRYILRLRDNVVWTTTMKEGIRIKLHNAFEWLCGQLQAFGSGIVGAIADNPEKLLQIGYGVLKM